MSSIVITGMKFTTFIDDGWHRCALCGSCATARRAPTMDVTPETLSSAPAICSSPVSLMIRIPLVRVCRDRVNCFAARQNQGLAA